jgi:hypothetical protein
MIKIRHESPPRYGAMLKLTLLTSLFVSLCGVCFGYNLYVDSEANQSGANGSQDHPYIHIQDAINHAFDDALPINETSPSVVINVYAYASGYQENLDLNYMGDDVTVPHFIDHFVMNI